MLVVMAWRKFLGFVRFEAEGVFCEKFMNLVAAEGIDIRSPIKSGIQLRGWVYANDYRRLRVPAKKSGVRLHIIKRSGLPFIIRKNRSRAGLAVGLAVFLVTLYIMSGFVWEIRVSGADRVDPELVLDIAEAHGLKAGTFKKKHNARAIESALLIDIKELAWVAVNIEGSVVNILIKESTPAPELFHDDDAPVNIVASKSGIIRRMEVYDGAVKAKVGDSIAQGGLLVSGVIEDEYMQLMLKHARAKVMAETEYSIIADFPLEQKLAQRTGQELRFRRAEFLGLEIPFYFRTYSGEAETFSELTRLYFLWLPLPIKMSTTVYMPVKHYTVTYTEEQAKGGALQHLEELEREQLADSEILSRKTSGGVENGKFVVRASYRCIMDIAKEEPILSKIPWENSDSWS